MLFDVQEQGEKIGKNIICDNVIVYLDETMMIYQKFY
jgi:hypothetical protein